MKKIILVLISLFVVLCLGACDGGKKFDDSELLQILEDNSWFVDKSQNLYVSFAKEDRSFYETKPNTSYYEKMEITKTEKLGDNKYKMTIHVPAFEGDWDGDPHDAYDLFFTMEYDFSKPNVLDCHVEKDDKSYTNDYHFVSDKGLSAEELMKELDAMGWYIDSPSGLLWRLDADKKVIEQTKNNTSYFFEGQITGIKYTYANQYEISVHVPAFEGSWDVDPYDAYNLIYTITFDKQQPTWVPCIVFKGDGTYSNHYNFVTYVEPEFDDGELMQLLEENSWFVDKAANLYISFDRSERVLYETKLNTSYYEKMNITDTEKLDDNKYRLTVHVPASEADYDGDPHPAYDLYFTIDYDFSKPTEFDCKVEKDDKSYTAAYHFVYDKGLSADELLQLLDENSWYYDSSANLMCRFVVGKKIYQETMPNTSFYLSAPITDIKYLGLNRYQLTYHVPASDADFDSDPHEAYDLINTIVFDPDYPIWFKSTMEDDKHTYANTYQFVSDKGLSMDELLKLLSGYSPYYCPKLETYARFNADKKTYMEYMDATSYSLLANVTELVYLHAGVYELTLHVDGFAGNEMMDPYDPYDIIMTLYIDTSHAVEYSANLDFIVQGYSVYGDFVTTAY